MLNKIKEVKKSITFVDKKCDEMDSNKLNMKVVYQNLKDLTEEKHPKM